MLATMRDINLKEMPLLYIIKKNSLVDMAVLFMVNLVHSLK